MKKVLFALLVGMFGVLVSGCDKKGPELAAVLEVTVLNSAQEKMVDYPVIITKSIATVPYAEIKRGVTDKNGVCRFEFKAGELPDNTYIDGTHLNGWAVVINPADQKPIGFRDFILHQGETLRLTAYGNLN